MRLLLIRHGHTVDNDGLIYSGQRDTPLTPRGERQADALAARLASEPLAALYTSDLARARATAERIAGPHRVTPQLRPALREIDMGAWAGKTYARLATEDAERVAAWIRDPERFAPLGGETAAHVRERVQQTLQRQLHEHATSSEAQRHVIAWVTHGGVIGVLLCDLLGIPTRERWRLHCDPGSITTLDLLVPPRHSGSRSPYDGSIHCLNDTAHLAPLR